LYRRTDRALFPRASAFRPRCSLLPAPFPLQNSLQRVPAGRRTKPLQRGSPGAMELRIAPRTVAGAQKNLVGMTLAGPAGTVFSFWRGLASALGSGDSAPAASACRSRTGDSGGWPSTPATAAPARGTPHCNNAPAAAGAGTSAYSPSTNISGAEGDEHEAWAPKLLGVDFPEKLKDLRVGPWEGDTPRSSSLEGEPIPLRGALFAMRESGNLATLPQTQIG